MNPSLQDIPLLHKKESSLQTPIKKTDRHVYEGVFFIFQKPFMLEFLLSFVCLFACSLASSFFVDFRPA